MIANRKKSQQGFTLIEILLVMTLLGFIGTLAVTNIMGRFQEGKQRGTVVILRELQTALDDYYRSCNHYPTTAQGGLEALITKPTTPPECRNYDTSGYLKNSKLPKDGWDRDFIYINEDGSRNYTLKSLGADGREGGEGPDKDLDIADPNL
jgi:general secretion pathway protein G